MIEPIQTRRGFMDEPRDHVDDRFQRFYRDNFTHTTRLARLLTNRPDIADDLAQDAFVRVHRYAQNADRPIDNPAALLRTTTVIVLLIERQPRQTIERVDWEAMIRQIASTHRLSDDNETSTWYATAGPEQVPARPLGVEGTTVGGHRIVRRQPHRFRRSPDDRRRLHRRPRTPRGNAATPPTRTGGNVVTALPYDDIVFDRTWERDGLTFASLCQIAVDCLTGFGRMPQEGEALLDWMRKRAPKWQASSLSELAALA